MNPELKEKCERIIKNDEGFMSNIYRDSRGYLTIGYGFNLESIEMPKEVADLWIKFILDSIEVKLSKLLNFWSDLNDVRKIVLINMAYNMGIDKLLKFNDMMKALGKKDYIQAEREMDDSLWNKEVPFRAARLRRMMLSGEF
jgi:lysozyme